MKPFDFRQSSSSDNHKNEGVHCCEYFTVSIIKLAAILLNDHSFTQLFCLLAVAAAEPGWGRGAWGRGSGWGGRSWGGRAWGARGWGGRWKREAEADPQLLLNNGLRTVYSGINTYPTMYNTIPTMYSGLNTYGLYNTGLINSGLRILKREADAEPGWGRSSWGGWGRRSWGGRAWGARGWGGRWKREAEADPQLLLNNGLRTVYSGINTYPTMYTSGLNTYSGLNMYSTGLFNTGLYNTGITHIVKRDADAEPGWGRNSWGWNGNAGRWGGWGRGSWSGRNTWGGRRGWSGRSWGRW